VLGPCSAAARCAVVAALIVVAACARSCARSPARAMGKATLRGDRTPCMPRRADVVITEPERSSSRPSYGLQYSGSAAGS
jgi:hypothetical protein